MGKISINDHIKDIKNRTYNYPYNQPLISYNSPKLAKHGVRNTRTL